VQPIPYRDPAVTVAPSHELLIVALVAHILTVSINLAEADVERLRNLDRDSGLAPRASATAT
jgi:hypothetical protein